MARRTTTYAIRLAVEGGGQVKAELVSVDQSGEQSLKRIESAGERASGGLKGLGRQAELLRTGIRTLGDALAGVATIGGLATLVDRSISAANAIGKTADTIGVGVEALQELRFAAKASGVEQQTLDMALQRFTRRAAEAAQGTGEAKHAFAQLGIALRDQSGNLRSSEDLFGDVADAFARIEDPAERVRLAFKLFDSEGVALVNLLRGGSDALEQMRERARDLGIVLDEHLVRDAERARTELDTLSQVISAIRTATEQHAAEIQKLNELLQAGAIDQATYARAVEDANDRALRSSQAWTDGATRFLKDYVAESNDAATATERAFANAFSGAEDSLVGFISSGKLEFRGLIDSVLADLARTTVRQTLTAPIAGALQSAFAGGGLFGLFHEGGIAGERPPATRYADAGVFEHAPRYHGGGFAGSGLLPDEVPIIARRGELVVPPERIVREEKSAREQRPITVVVNVTAADASSFRASQGQIAADMARAIDRASRNR
jgi:Lambda phage tail tape-measure protein (Tape_meas_lam_C)